MNSRQYSAIAASGTSQPDLGPRASTHSSRVTSRHSGPTSLGMKQPHIFRLSALFPYALGLLGAALFIQIRALAPAETRSEGEQLMQKSDCLSCHAIDHKVVGPAFSEV